MALRIEVERLKEMSQENQREHDLVRQQRRELFRDNLITDKEYASLAGEQGNLKRLRDYDHVRLEIAELQAECQRIVTAVIYEVGGTAGGVPTSPINYLQRLRELVKKEAEFTTRAAEWKEAERVFLLAEEEAAAYKKVLVDIVVVNGNDTHMTSCECSICAVLRKYDEHSV
jgi:hypothetical protein